VKPDPKRLAVRSGAIAQGGRNIFPSYCLDDVCRKQNIENLFLAPTAALVDQIKPPRFLPLLHGPGCFRFRAASKLQQSEFLS
jgi:hypothetical protein